MAAFADRAAAPFGLRAGGILSLRAALADMAELVEPLPDVADLEPVESRGARVGNDMQAAEQLVFLASLGCEVRPDDVFQPVQQEFLDGRHVRLDRHTAG